MKVEQMYTQCLAEAAYYIESDGEAAIIDPLREVAPYLKKLKEQQSQLKYIFETHFHADFVSGHIDLSKKTGAPIVYGPTAQTEFESIIAEEGQEFTIGKVTLKVLHTPGHTPESVTYLLIDESGKNRAIFTGDTLFLGDVGRPDLAIKGNLTQEKLAGMLYDSLRDKIMPLEDDIIVYPAHGAGSSCGKNLSKETYGTLGEQKQTNYALDPKMTKEAFIKELTTGILPPPQYFAKNAMLNKMGYKSIDDVMQKGNKALSLDEFIKLKEKGALVLDVRHQNDFCKAHIPNALFIGLEGTFAMWLGALVENINQPILLIAPEGREEEAIVRMARVGYDNTQGYLKGGVNTWLEAGEKTEKIDSISPESFSDFYQNNHSLDVVDVRKPGEYESNHLKFARSLPLDFIEENYSQINEEEKTYIHCAGGYRSVIAASILKSKGIYNIVNVEKGFSEIKNTPLKSEIISSECSVKK